MHNLCPIEVDISVGGLSSIVATRINDEAVIGVDVPTSIESVIARGRITW